MGSSSKPDVSPQPVTISTAPPVGFGVIGMGGYGSHVLRCIRENGTTTHPPVRLLAACDPDTERFQIQMDQLRSDGISVYNKVEDLLADKAIQAVWLPVPITLHRKFTTMALEHGKSVMCEKPAAATVDEVDQMIAARDHARKVVAIGFQDIYDPLVQDAKRRILAGEIGVIKSASVWGIWPRDSAYYGRNTWAGAIGKQGQWVLDSPASNAMAHFITLLLFLMGKTQETAEIPVSIEAELYRANPIQNYDTCSLRVTVESGATILIMLSHAGQIESVTDTVLNGETGSLSFCNRESMTWTTPAGPQFQKRSEPFSSMVRAFADTVRGIPTLTNLASLEIARQHTVIINGASQVAPIHTVAEERIKLIEHTEGVTTRAIDKIDQLFRECILRGQMLHESGLCPWSKPAMKLDLRGYKHFAGPMKS